MRRERRREGLEEKIDLVGGRSYTQKLRTEKDVREKEKSYAKSLQRLWLIFQTFHLGNDKDVGQITIRPPGEIILSNTNAD